MEHRGLGKLAAPTRFVATESSDEPWLKLRNLVLSWERIATLPECTAVALGDAGVASYEGWSLPEDDLPDPSEFPFVCLGDDGGGMTVGLAEDHDLAVDLGTIEGTVVAARVRFRDDIDQLRQKRKGRWRFLAFVEIGEEGALAMDPVRQDERVDGSHPWRQFVPLPAGRYAAHYFVHSGDQSGLRLVSEALLKSELNRRK